MEATNQNIYLIHLIANEIHILRQRLILIRTQGLSIRIIGDRVMTGAVAGFEAIGLRASEEDAAKRIVAGVPISGDVTRRRCLGRP